MAFELKQSQFDLIEQRSSGEDLKVLLALLRDHGGIELVEDELAENDEGDLELVEQEDPIVLHQAGLLAPEEELGSEEPEELSSEDAGASEAPADGEGDGEASEPSSF